MNIRKNIVKLLRQKFRSYLHDTCYAGSILGYDGRDCAHSVDSVGSHCL